MRSCFFYNFLSVFLINDESTCHIVASPLQIEFDCVYLVTISTMFWRFNPRNLNLLHLLCECTMHESFPNFNFFITISLCSSTPDKRPLVRSRLTFDVAQETEMRQAKTCQRKGGRRSESRKLKNLL